MVSDRFLEIFEMVRLAEAESPGEVKLCSIAAAVMKVDGAGIALRTELDAFTILCASSDIAHDLLDIEVAVGEGPCLDVCKTDSVVSEGYLDSLAVARWPIYGPTAKLSGAGGVFAFPIDIGAIRLGALFAYSERSGSLSPQQWGDASLMASVIARAVLALQAGAPHGALGSELERASTFDPVVQQAAGMVAVQGLMSIGDALVTLRAHGYATGESSSRLAARIVARELFYDLANGYWTDSEPIFDGDAP